MNACRSAQGSAHQPGRLPWFLSAPSRVQGTPGAPSRYSGYCYCQQQKGLLPESWCLSGSWRSEQSRGRRLSSSSSSSKWSSSLVLVLLVLVALVSLARTPRPLPQRPGKATAVATRQTRGCRRRRGAWRTLSPWRSGPVAAGSEHRSPCASWTCWSAVGRHRGGSRAGSSPRHGCIAR